MSDKIIHEVQIELDASTKELVKELLRQKSLTINNLQNEISQVNKLVDSQLVLITKTFLGARGLDGTYTLNAEGTTLSPVKQ